MKNKQSKLIHYEIRGQGKRTVLLINGLARSSRHWFDFPDYLVKKGLRIILVDNRGFGRSKHLNLGLRSRASDFAQDIMLVLEKENIEDLHVVGLSLGGMIALELAGLIPTQVKSLTIVNSSAANTHHMRISSKGLLKLGKMGLQRSVEMRTKVELQALTTLDEKSTRYKEVFDAFVEYEKMEPVKVQNVPLQLNAAIHFKLEPIRQNIKMPLLVLYSSHDAFVPNQNSFGLQKKLPQATVRCIEGKGHELMIEDPEGVSRLIDEHTATAQ